MYKELKLSFDGGDIEKKQRKRKEQKKITKMYHNLTREI